MKENKNSQKCKRIERIERFGRVERTIGEKTKIND
jgi:hypothetical protein